MPFVPYLRIVSRNIEQPGKTRSGRLIDKSHPRLPGSSARLSPVTGYAGTDHILPGVLSPAEPGNNMVKGKLLDLSPAVLTGIPVTFEYLKPGKPSVSPVRTPYHRSKTDYRWYREFIINRMNKTRAVLQHFRLVLINKYHRPPHPTDVKRLVTLIQYQNRRINHN